MIRFGGEATEYLALTISGRSLPDSQDYWDGNWLVCRAEVAAGAFRGSVDRLLRNEDLARFLGWVERLYEVPSGEALFATLDGWLDLRLIRDRKGHVEARGQLCDDPVEGNVLEFRLFGDQTDLPPLIAQLRAALAAFPVVGESRLR
ncbi:MAG: hypothetical protein K2X82_09195 [Gemmataceae bacterium]|nr:hypothetical protein [Gemmataceae bacterium]